MTNISSAGQRLSEERQALVHPVIDAGVIIRELLVPVRDAELIRTGERRRAG